MEAATGFYEALAGTSLTLLGLWIGVLQLAPAGWRIDPTGRASTLHLSLKFFLPGVLGLTSLLSAAGDNAAVWRVSFAVGGLVGFVESVRYLGRVTRPAALRRLAVVDPVLYLMIVAAALLPASVLPVPPLQAEGIVTTLVFVTGLVGVWFALADRRPEAAVRTATPPGRRVPPGPRAG